MKNSFKLYMYMFPFLKFKHFELKQLISSEKHFRGSD